MAERLPATHGARLAATEAPAPRIAAFEILNGESEGEDQEHDDTDAAAESDGGNQVFRYIGDQDSSNAWQSVSASDPHAVLTGPRPRKPSRPASWIRPIASTRRGSASAEAGCRCLKRIAVGCRTNVWGVDPAGAGWADGRSFTFKRSLEGRPELVWRHLTGPSLLAHWWTPQDLRVSELVFEARAGGRIVQEYRDAQDTSGSDTVAGRAEGVVEDVRPGERLACRLSPLLPDGTPAFTAHIDMRLGPGEGGTNIEVVWRITDRTVGSADFIAGIKTGFGQSLDKLAKIFAADPHDNNSTDTRSTK
ncbi:SRPBCC domain-containing protein [Streptomyces sp. NPDC006692]|uniref:SRPBCC family protein n=1 Tax=Streptomyces sp. NPDC006692 TaxID=3364758 RepID=UPI0036B60110